jgi:hypothetical protein
MRLLIHVIAGLHLAVYLGIMWYGWQSYKLLRKKSWRYMGIGFSVLLIYRTWRFVEQLFTEQISDAERTLLPFIGAVFLLIAFRMLCSEHRNLLSLMAEPVSLRSGAQPVEYWLSNFRTIVREEVAALRATSKD